MKEEEVEEEEEEGRVEVKHKKRTNDRARRDNEDAVALGNRRQAMRDADDRVGLEDLLDDLLNLLVGRHVERRGGLVHDEDFRLDKEGAGNA